MRLASAALALGFCVALPIHADGGEVRRTVLNFSDLKGWASDNHTEALRVFRETCDLIQDETFGPVCAAAKTASDARRFFEDRFLPVLAQDDRAPLFTGYYEPELPGARARGGAYQFPLYRRPPELVQGKPWLTRAEIETSGVLSGRGLEVAWLSDPVEAFFLHVQGSGRLRLPDGSAMRVGFAGKNGHKYRSVGREMARQGHLSDHRLSAASIKNWVRKNPEAGRKILWHNPSFVFFREIADLPSDAGPIGAMGRSVTAMRTIAVDPGYVPLGAPVWVEKAGKKPLRRLMVAQDTGSAIKGPQRADIFYGSGKKAGDQAGRIRDGGRMLVLLPRRLATGLASGG